VIDLARIKVSMHRNAYILWCGNRRANWSPISHITRIETVLRQYATAQLASHFLNLDSIIIRMKLISDVLNRINSCKDLSIKAV